MLLVCTVCWSLCNVYDVSDYLSCLSAYFEILQEEPKCLVIFVKHIWIASIFMYPLVRRLLMFHMTAILMARELSSIIGSYCIELIDLRWHGTPWKFNGDGSMYNIFGGYELFLDKDLFSSQTTLYFNWFTNIAII